MIMVYAIASRVVSEWEGEVGHTCSYKQSDLVIGDRVWANMLVSVKYNRMSGWVRGRGKTWWWPSTSTSKVSDRERARTMMSAITSEWYSEGKHTSCVVCAITKWVRGRRQTSWWVSESTITSSHTAVGNFPTLHPQKHSIVIWLMRTHSSLTTHRSVKIAVRVSASLDFYKKHMHTASW